MAKTWDRGLTDRAANPALRARRMPARWRGSNTPGTRRVDASKGWHQMSTNLTAPRFSTTATVKIAGCSTGDVIARFGFKDGWEENPHIVVSALISAGWLPRGSVAVHGRWIGGWHNTSVMSDACWPWQDNFANAKAGIDSSWLVCPEGVNHWWIKTPDGRTVDLLRDRFVAEDGRTAPWVYVTPQDVDQDNESSCYSAQPA